MISQIPDFLFSLTLIGIPECTAMTMLMLALLKLNFNWKKIIFLSILQALIVITFRTISNSIELPGIQTAAAVISLGLLVSYLWKAPKVKALICSIIIIILVMIFEVLYYKLFEIIFSVSFEQIVQTKAYWVLGSWLHILSLAIIAIIITKTKWYKKGLPNNTPFNNIGAR